MLANAPLTWLLAYVAAVALTLGVLVLGLAAWLGRELWVTRAAFWTLRAAYQTRQAQRSREVERAVRQDERSRVVSDVLEVAHRRSSIPESGPVSVYPPPLPVSDPPDWSDSRPPTERRLSAPEPLAATVVARPMPIDLDRSRAIDPQAKPTGVWPHRKLPPIDKSSP
jgi:hypothetical protein